MTDDAILGICSFGALTIISVSFFVYLSIQAWKLPPAEPTSSDTLTDRMKSLYSPYGFNTSIHFTGTPEEWTKFCKDNGIDPTIFGSVKNTDK